MRNATAPTAAAAPPPALVLGPEMTIAHAATWYAALAAALQEAPATLALDLSGVTDFDSSGVQLLLATRRSLVERGDALHIVAASPPVSEALATFGLQALLGTAHTAAAPA
jgi:anti-anti-sigma factor